MEWRIARPAVIPFPFELLVVAERLACVKDFFIRDLFYECDLCDAITRYLKSRDRESIIVRVKI